jgi:hypothetical protein
VVDRALEHRHGELRSEVRLAVASALPALSDACARPPPEVPPQEAAPEAPGPEAIQAFDDANRLLDGALARRTWNDQDREALNRLAFALDPQSRDEIMHRLARSVNEGKLNVTGHVF